MKRITVLVLCAVVLACATLAHAAILPLVGYDVYNSPKSGFGCWGHTYSGTEIDTGRTLSAGVTCGMDANKIVNYVGGGGTLNDGVISGDPNEVHLLAYALADDGLPIDPSIVLHLNEQSTINKINVFGGRVSYNVLPGALQSATVEIGGQSAVVSVTPTGYPNELGIYPDGVLDLSSTSLSQVPTTTITLKNFSASIFGSPFEYFSLAEVTVESAPYNFTGFFPPVDNLPVVNGVQAGRAIPVKFSLGGNKGLDIFTPGYPAVEIVSCTSAVVATVETTVTAGNSSLSYDPDSDQYVYVWKTDKAWAGKCGNLRVMLNDGMTYTALFNFTR